MGPCHYSATTPYLPQSPSVVSEVGPQTSKFLSKMHFNFAVMELRSHGIKEGHGKSSIAPLFQSRAIKNKQTLDHMQMLMDGQMNMDRQKMSAC